MIKPDSWIQEKCARDIMIEPFHDRLIRDGAISYGLSSYGYDFRISNVFRVPIAEKISEIDPKNIHDECFDEVITNVFVLAPHSFCLAGSREYFRIPEDVLSVCIGKSTYARCGVVINITPLEPGWEGYLTISISNTSPFPVRLYADEGIAQVLFFQSAKRCDVSYKDRKGIYQAQQEITAARVGE